MGAPPHTSPQEWTADQIWTGRTDEPDLRAVPRSSVLHGAAYQVEGEIPAGRVHELERQLPSLTRGEGVVESAFEHYRKVTGENPTRPRTDHNPLNWKEYLLHVQRRV